MRMERFVADERTGLKYELVGDYYLIAGDDDPETPSPWITPLQTMWVMKGYTQRITKVFRFQIDSFHGLPLGFLAQILLIFRIEIQTLLPALFLQIGNSGFFGKAGILRLFLLRQFLGRYPDFTSSFRCFLMPLTNGLLHHGQLLFQVHKVQDNDHECVLNNRNNIAYLCKHFYA